MPTASPGAPRSTRWPRAYATAAASDGPPDAVPSNPPHAATAAMTAAAPMSAARAFGVLTMAGILDMVRPFEACGWRRVWCALSWSSRLDGRADAERVGRVVIPLDLPEPGVVDG